MSSPAFPQNANDRPSTLGSSRLAWFCLQAQAKHEHLVAAHLRKMDRVEVFLPRIRFQRATRKGMQWVTEALFPNYLFTRFEWPAAMRRVQHASGARGIVHFGQNWPVIPDETIEELRRAVGMDELHTISEELAAGDDVQVADGTLRGLRAVVSRVMPGRQRVAVLMDLLGRQTMIELPTQSLIKEGDRRATLLNRNVPG